MVERIGISLDKKLLAQFDGLIAAKGYSNRSEAVRDLIREKLIEREWSLPTGETVGTLLLVYEHETMELSRRLAKLEHEAFHHVVATLHVHMDEENCLEVIVLRGPGPEIQKLAERLISLRGVKQGRFVPGTTGRDL
jgi:CopG family nickel-responsive transcriptional regulator